MPMNPTEFLEILRGQLLTEMPAIEAASHVQYYEDYITSQMAAGCSQEEILVQLGDPRLIAKTIMDTSQQGSNSGGSYDSSEGTHGSEGESRPHSGKRLFASVDLSTWYGKLFVILMSAAILFLLITIVSALIPVVLIVGAVLFVIFQLKKRG